MPKPANAIKSYLSTAHDQTVPSMNTIQPTTVGIAHNKRLHAQLNRAIAASDTLHSIIDTRDNGTDPEERAFAGKLLNDPNFLKTFSLLLDILKDDITAAGAAKVKAAAPAGGESDGEGVSDPTTPKTELLDPNMLEQNGQTVARSGGGSGLPGTDAAITHYTVEHLRRDLAARRAAPTILYRRNPGAGMDAAIASAAKMRFVLDWADTRWTDEARVEYRRIASYDTDAREDLARHGISPEHESAYNSQRAAEKWAAGKWEGDQQA